jgi:prephenate dehydratase
MLTLAYLGPTGTYTEAAAIAYCNWLERSCGGQGKLVPHPSISQTLEALLTRSCDLAVIPIENSIQGSVTVSLDRFWEKEHLQVQQALVLPIHHALISRGGGLDEIKTVYSHPQALAQCQHWLERQLPHVSLHSTNSTAEALQYLQDATVGAIASERAAHLYDLPILAHAINDHQDNCTRFWVVRAWERDIPLPQAPGRPYLSLAFSLPQNSPGALLNPLQVLANYGINMTRIESRPTKRLLGEYLFFVDVEAPENEVILSEAIAHLRKFTEILKVFGTYTVLTVGPGSRE